MRKTKLWSVLLAAVLLIACVVGVLIVGAQAEATTVEFVVGKDSVSENQTPGTDGKYYFTELSEAIAYLKTADGKGLFTGKDAKLDVLLMTSQVAKGDGGSSEVLWSLPTLFTGSDNMQKLPITIRGNEKALTLAWPGASMTVSCANDYTFDTLTLPWANEASNTTFNAGVGLITFNNVSFGSGSKLYLYADTHTRGVYNAWSQEQVNANLVDDDGNGTKTITTGIVFGAGTTYAGAANNPANIRCRGNAGLIQSTHTNPIAPTNTKHKIVLMAGASTGCRIYAASANIAENAQSDEMIIDIQKGSNLTGNLQGLRQVEVYGNLTINYDCDSGKWPVGLYESILHGTLNMTMGSTVKGSYVYGMQAQTDNKYALVDGTVNITLDGVKNDSFVLKTGHSKGSVDGTVNITLKNGAEIKTLNAGTDSVANGSGYENGDQFEMNINILVKDGSKVDTLLGAGTGKNVASVTTTIESGSTVTNYYGGTNTSGATIGSITNKISGGTITNYYGGSAGGTVSGTITNYFGDREGTDDAVITDTMCGGMAAGTVTKVVNVFGEDFKLDWASKTSANADFAGNGTITNCVENTFYGGNFVGGDTGGAGGNVHFRCGGDATFGTPVLAAGETLEYRIKNHLMGGSIVKGRLILGGNASGTKLRDDPYGILNIYENDPQDESYMSVSGGVVYNALSGSIGKIKNIIKGTFENVLTCGTNNGTVTAIENYILDGAKVSYLQTTNNSGGTVTTVTNHLQGGSIELDFRGVTGTATNVTNYFGKPNASGGYGDTLDEGTTFNGKFSITGANGNTVSKSEKVVNYVYGGTFKCPVYLGPLGPSSGDNSATVSAIENYIYGGTFEQVVYGGGKNERTAVGTISNVISGGTFTGKFYGGSIAGTVGSIKNTVIDCTMADSFVGGNKTATFTSSRAAAYCIENEIYGGSFARIYCGSENADVESICNTISTDVVTANAYGGNGTSGSIGKIVNKVVAGKNDAEKTQATLVTLYGGNNNAKGTIDSITNTVEGGVLNAFYGGCNFYGDVKEINTTINSVKMVVPENSAASNVAGANRAVAFSGKSTLTIKGGEFINILAGSLAAADQGATTALVIDATAGEITVTESVTGCTQLTTSASGRLSIDSDTHIEIVEPLTTTVYLKQIGEWKHRRYVSAKGEGVSFDLTPATDIVEGKVESGMTYLEGYLELKGYKLVLGDRVQIKLYFQDETPATYSFTTTSGAKLNAVPGEDADGKFLLLDAIGLGEFDTAIIFEMEGYAPFERSILQLAENGASYSDGGSEEEILFQAIVNMGLVANGQEAKYTQVPTIDAASVSMPGAAATKRDDLCVKFESQALLMSNAIGFRLSGTAASGVTVEDSVKIYLNEVSEENDVTSFCRFGQSDTSFTMDLYVNAANMKDEIRLIITDASGEGEEVILDMVTRIDALAAKVVTVHSDALAQQVLNYIYAADTYKNSKA